MNRIARCLLVATVAVAASPSMAWAEPPRFAVLIGNNRGSADQVELRYAEDDALKMFEVLQGLGGFAAANTLLVRGARAGRVNEALLSVNARIRALDRGTRDRSILLVYYSGHGDATNLHLGTSKLAIERLTKIVRASPAAYRVLILDSCRSGAATRVKGGRRINAVPIALQAKLESEGLVILTASAAGEEAQESDALGSSFFTHYLVSGLLGAADSDRDGAVGLLEAYEFAYTHTLRESSRTLHGVQHPTFRVDVRGHQNVPLTRVRSSSSRGLVELPRGADYIVMRGSARGRVVAEIRDTDPVRRLSLAPGSYFVRARSKDHLREGTIEVRGGTNTRVDTGRFKRVAYARLVRKGTGELRMVHGPRASLFGRSPLLGGEGCFGVAAAYPFETRYLTAVPQLSWCAEDRIGFTLTSRLDEVTASMMIGHSWDLAWGTTVELGVLGGLSILSQRFRGASATPARQSMGAVIGTQAGLVRALYGGFYARLGLGTRSYLLQTLESDSGLVIDEYATTKQHFAFATELGLGRWW